MHSRLPSAPTGRHAKGTAHFCSSSHKTFCFPPPLQGSSRPTRRPSAAGPRLQEVRQAGRQAGEVTLRHGLDAYTHTCMHLIHIDGGAVGEVTAALEKEAAESEERSEATARAFRQGQIKVRSVRIVIYFHLCDLLDAAVNMT